MTSDKAYSTEQRLDTLVGQGWAVPLSVWKTYTETRTTSAMTADDQLTLPVEAGARYEWGALIGYYGGTGAGEGDFRWSFDTPAAAECRYGVKYRNASGSLASPTWQHGADVLTAQTIGVTDEQAVEVGRGYLLTIGAGDFGLRWGQGSTNATGTRLIAGSYLALRRMG